MLLLRYKMVRSPLLAFLKLVIIYVKRYQKKVPLKASCRSISGFFLLAVNKMSHLVQTAFYVCLQKFMDWFVMETIA